MIARALLLGATVAATACSLDVPPPTVPEGTGYVAGLPVGWSSVGTPGGRFDVGTEPGRTNASGLSIVMRGNSQTSSGFAGFAQAVNATSYAGRRVRFSAWVSTSGVGANGARLWMRVDSPTHISAFDNMEERRVTGTTAWHQVSVVLDVAADALGFTFGGMLSDGGEARWSELRLEVVGTDVPVTGGPVGARYTTAESDALRAMYLNAPITPVNLDLAVRDLVTNPAAVAWLKREAVTFNGAAPAASVSDLAFLRDMVGSATLVGLGEGTHGTREFFQMKHRILQYLVQELGFTAFAIEATWPESNDLDTYVRTGQGDPEVLLSHLYFWTWNTREVLDMIRWMREHNATVPPDRQVGFLGFDMQFPGAAMDTVTAYVRRVDPAAAPAVDSAYACLAPYRNRRQVMSALRYDQLGEQARAACRAALDGVHANLASAATRYVPRATAEEHARAVQSARLVVQWEDMTAGGGTLARDRYMAENVGWLRAQLPPGTRMALWAHNQHVANLPGMMGSYLRAAHGADYRIVGFTFGTGSFNARPMSGTSLGSVTALSTTHVTPGSFEAHAQATALGPFAVDMRRTVGAPDASALAGQLPMRNIGAGYDPTRPYSYFGIAALSQRYDLLIHFPTSSASQLLPFQY